MLDVQNGWAQQPCLTSPKPSPWVGCCIGIPILGEVPVDPGFPRCRGHPIITHAALPSTPGASVPQHILYLLAGSQSWGRAIPLGNSSSALCFIGVPDRVFAIQEHCGVVKLPIVLQQWDCHSGFRSTRHSAMHQHLIMGLRSAVAWRLRGGLSRSRQATSRILIWRGSLSTWKRCHRCHR